MRLSDIIRRIERIFEKKRKNPIQIEDDSNLESKLKNVKVADTNTPIQISTDTVDIKGSLKVNGVDVSTEPDDDTDTGATELNELSDVTYSSGDLTISSLDTIISGALTFNSSGDIALSADGGNVTMDDGTTTVFDFDVDNVALKIMDDADTGDYLSIAVGAAGETTLTTVDDGGAAAHLNIEPDGHVEFDGCSVGFDLVTPTYNASDTNVDFQTGNKQFVTFGSGNITDLNLIFPATSGNFVLMLKQDGTGSRTVTNYKAWDRADDDAASGSATVKFAGGSNPTLTTDANHVDIISIFYDADNQIAYGVATLDFQF